MDYYVNNKSFDLSPQALEINRGNENYTFFVLNGGTEIIKKSPSYAQQHKHPVYHIVLYYEGETSFLVNDIPYEGKPGVLVLTEPGERHCFRAYGNKGSKTVYKCFSFILKNLRSGASLSLPFHELLSLYSGMELKKVNFPVTLNKRQMNTVASLIDKSVMLLAEGGSFSRFSTCLSILSLLDAIVSELYLKGGMESTLREFPLFKVKEYIEKNYNRKMSIKELSEKAGLSEGHFMREFKKTYKASPVAYQLELKINAAKIFLTTTDLSMEDIAERTGFSDVYYFSRTFKRIAGMPPSEYRKKSFTKG